MQTTLLLIASLFSIYSGTSDSPTEERAAELQAQIEQKEAELEILQDELNQIIGDLEESEAREYLAVGDSYTIDNIKLTLESAEFTSERNQFVLYMPEHVLQINYIIENNSEGDYPVTAPFEVFVNGEAMDTYPNENTLEVIEDGETLEGAAYYRIEDFEIGDPIEIHWTPLFHFGEERAVWLINIEPSEE